MIRFTAADSAVEDNCLWWDAAQLNLCGADSMHAPYVVLLCGFRLAVDIAMRLFWAAALLQAVQATAMN